MKTNQFIDFLLKENNISFEIKDGKIIINGGYVDLSSLTTLPENVQFNNGGDVYLSSLTTLPENVQFNNGGYVYLKTDKIKIGKNYFERFSVKKEGDFYILYKRVSKEFKTQEGEKNETLWRVSEEIIHPAWNPQNSECGEGKFHACAKPYWSDVFRNKKGDKYIAIKVLKEDTYEWTQNPSYPQKIGFKKGIALYECDRIGDKI